MVGRLSLRTRLDLSIKINNLWSLFYEIIFKIILSVCMSVQIVLSVFIAWENVEAVSIDLNVSAQSQVSGTEESSVLIHILVLSPLKELTLHDSRILLHWFEYWNSVVWEVERYDEASVHVFRNSCVEPGSESQHFFIVVNILEEVPLWFLRKQLVNVTEGINFVSKSIVRRDLDGLGLSRLRELNLSKFKMLAVLRLVEILSELVHSVDSEYSTKCIDDTSWLNFITSQVIISDKVLSWLVDCETLRQFLPSK